MKGRQYQHRQVRTSGGWLAIGGEYLLKTVGFEARVKLLRDRSTDDALKFRVEVLQAAAVHLDAGSRITLTAGWDGQGNWQLLDVGPEGE